MLEGKKPPAPERSPPIASEITLDSHMWIGEKGLPPVVGLVTRSPFGLLPKESPGIILFMDNKRYQVFISSTFTDLMDERRAVIQTVIEQDCIPAGMELFPATDEEQLEFIKRVIDDCDYYLLIIGGRYGTVGKDGISYTEKEFDYAVSRGLRIIALIHESPGDIPLRKSEQDPALRERLQQFKEKVAGGPRLVKYWKSAADLPAFVSLGLSKTIKMFPAVGWIRANRATNEEVLSEINELRKRNVELETALARMRQVPAVDGLAGLDEKVTVHGSYNDRRVAMERTWDVEVTWREIFALVSPYLLEAPTDKFVNTVLTTALFKKYGHLGDEPWIDNQDFKTISIQLKALGLVRLDHLEARQGGMALFWSLTPPGEHLMMQLRTVRTATPPGAMMKPFPPK
jgi:hypothetical protein